MTDEVNDINVCAYCGDEFEDDQGEMSDALCNRDPDWLCHECIEELESDDEDDEENEDD